MRYCSTCEHGNEERARFCFSCGQEMLATEPPVPEYPVPATVPYRVYQPDQPKQSGGSRMAIAGLVFGIISIIFTIALFTGSVGVAIPLVCVIAGCLCPSSASTGTGIKATA